MKNIRRAEPAVHPENKNTILNVDIGMKDRIKADFIIGAIVEATGLPVGAVEKVRIYDDYSSIELAPKDAEIVLSRMNGYRIKQREVHFTRAGKMKQPEHQSGAGRYSGAKRPGGRQGNNYGSKNKYHGGRDNLKKR